MIAPVRVREIEPLVVNVATAGKLIGVSKSTVYELEKRGLLALIRIGPRTTVVDVAELRRFVKERTAAAKAEQDARRSLRPLRRSA